MKAITQTSEMKNRRVLLSSLWIFVTANYIFCDVMTLMNSEDLKQIMTGTVGSIEMTPNFLLGAAIFMEIPFIMILLSRVLRHKANRLFNIIAGFIMTLIQIMSLFVGSGATPHYIFFSIIEISCTAFIVWYAWTWTQAD
ncbi:MAG: hypothetical protein E4H10_12545 [Bacteroidia bacterium]|nr:MAG: hypothetical protein E4H10_12545 [Bacteroidia bacterium]